MKFYLDHDVDADVRAMLIRRGHQAWITGQAGRDRTGDDEQTVYAMDRGAVLITHDVEFTERRKLIPYGRHIRMKCLEWVASDLLATVLDDVLTKLRASENMVVEISPGDGNTPRVKTWFGTETRSRRRQSDGGEPTGGSGVSAS